MSRGDVLAAFDVPLPKDRGVIIPIGVLVHQQNVRLALFAAHDARGLLGRFILGPDHKAQGQRDGAYNYSHAISSSTFHGPFTFPTKP